MTQQHPATQAILQYFTYDHLPEGPLRATSKACADLALRIAADLPAGGAELTAGLRKLLEAKDCFARAALPNLPTVPIRPDPLTIPADRFDLTPWSLTTPEPGAPTVADLSDYVHPQFFHLDGDELVFAANAGGGTTANSSYPRCELRELIAGERAAWSTTQGRHTLSLAGAVTKAPPAKPQVVMAQIHDASDDVIEVMYDGRKGGGALVVRHNGHQRGTLLQPYLLGTTAPLTITAADGVIEVGIEGMKPLRFDHEADGCYFKAGCYVQSNPGRGDAPDALGEVHFSRIDPPQHTD